MKSFAKQSVFLIIMLPIFAMAQVKLPVLHDSLFSTYYHQQWTLFQALPQTSGTTVFLGNSITDGGEWSEMFNDIGIMNRGISADISAGVLHRIEHIAKQKPSKIFLLIGTNDLARDISTDSLIKNILLINAYLKQESPATKLFIQSILPVTDVYGKFSSHTNKTDSILKVNRRLSAEAANFHYTFINLYPFFCSSNGRLNAKYTNDGLHLLGEGYLLWKHLLYPYLYGLQQKASLIPLPQILNWKDGFFPLYKCREIIADKNSLANEAEALQKSLAEKGWQTDIKSRTDNKETNIELRLASPALPNTSNEAYTLKVTENKILITANNAHGIFNGIQTLRQLMRDGVMVDACEITDWPAFSWRGYMIDVGRNYMSMDLLKEQIDAMALSKLNVFHFHPTEDIAWRIAIKQYPQLTEPEYMLRNKGMYYTTAEIKELIDYCKKKHILFLPEIDMPGHSAAFKRAMNTDMQSDSGLLIVKNILKEFCETYDVPYIHIGADEVKITNKNFVPEVTAYIESFGKKVIGWQPGGNFTNSTIRQLWMEDKSHLSNNSNIQFIDSRHLYLNHMDPLEAVVTIFNRKIGDKEKGDASVLGGTICTWQDRAVSKDEDIIAMNPVYPGILAFGERSWRGGGQSGWITNIDDGDKKGFIDFENRLLDTKKQFFKNQLFNYTRQANQVWKLYGPYNNAGDVKKQFLPETKNWNEAKAKVYKEQTGGTIVLKHWWAALIKGAIDNPKDSTTWYATTKIWADEEGEKKFWIGFYNISRSQSTNSPPQNNWDVKGSAVWVNDILIDPPKWKRPGQTGNLEIPLIDEGYEYRAASIIHLKKGWNSVLIKAPIGSFAGPNWNNPVKWMFTFVMKDSGDE